MTSKHNQSTVREAVGIFLKANIYTKPLMNSFQLVSISPTSGFLPVNTQSNSALAISTTRSMSQLTAMRDQAQRL